MTKHPIQAASFFFFLVLVPLSALALEIPSELPAPDGKSADQSKPVKVYILVGQSNMAGMGDLSGARPLYPSIFLSADPAIIPGSMPIGGAGLGVHGVSQSAVANAAKGAKASIYQLAE